MHTDFVNTLFLSSVASVPSSSSASSPTNSPSSQDNKHTHIVPITNVSSSSISVSPAQSLQKLTHWLVDASLTDLIFEKLRTHMRDEITKRHKQTAPPGTPVVVPRERADPALVLSTQTTRRSPARRRVTTSPTKRKKQASPSPARSQKKLAFGNPPAAVTDYTRAFLLAFLELQFLEDLIPLQLLPVMESMSNCQDLKSEQHKLLLELCPLLYRFVITDDYNNNRHVFRLLFFFIFRALSTFEKGMYVRASMPPFHV